MNRTVPGSRVSACGLLAAALLTMSLSGCAVFADDGPDVGRAPDGWGPAEDWVLPTTTPLDPVDFVKGVDNPYWPLVPGTTWIYEAQSAEGVERIEVVVLDETRVVAGIECVVVRDTVLLDGEVIEDTYDWYAQDADGNVWYMGEDVNNYEDGELVNHDGAWEAGVDGALPGIKVWAVPRVNLAPYYQEYHEGKAEDLGRDVSVNGEASVPFGEYRDLLVVEEWNALEPGVVERKYYAQGIGTVREEMARGGSEVVELVEFTTP